MEIIVTKNNRIKSGDFSQFFALSANDSLQELVLKARNSGDNRGLAGTIDSQNQSAVIIIGRQKYMQLWAELHRRDVVRLVVRGQGLSIEDVQALSIEEDPC
jgi:hypothetical protein